MQLAELPAHQSARDRGNGALGKRRVNQTRLAPELDGKLSGTQRIADRGHRRDQQIIRRITWTVDDGGRILAEDWSEKGNGSKTTAPRL